ncbi:aldehyde dehydrogenase [Cantharellus anzutake]|uniref:aldehyde dehydrogenase n=1 Tax=Cantharellus anzutake TaxID=1750568 RepID=UPI0019074D63|nr:aldehyde dehydrogenase [Cantharellus anzutake]KAF8333464.1 aldehyde dehydrogenase [Cantharellus anzutake]
MGAPLYQDFPTFKERIETGLFINNEFVESSDRSTFDLVSPLNNKLLAKVSSATKGDVDKAVDAAEAAFPAWSALTGKQRAGYLRKLSDRILAHREHLTNLEVNAIGKPKSTLEFEFQWTVEFLDTLVAQAEAIYGNVSVNQPGFMNLTYKQPYGVVAGIIPWNLGTPMMLWKIGPAVAAGNCIVLKASEKSPLISIEVAKCIVEAGFPPGVINILQGTGQSGQYIAEHMKIRKLAFTGSTATGRRVQAAAALSNLKVVTLELGGKSPSIIFADADLKSAVETVALSSLVNLGQVCTSNTRIYVEESVADQFLEGLKQAFAVWTSLQGDPNDNNTLISTLADSIQTMNVNSLIDVAKTEGKLVVGGEGKGAFVQPTIFKDVADDAKINTTEVFGPVLVYHTFKTEEEVLKRANDTEYGLFSSVFTSNLDRAIRFSRKLESGMVGINSASPLLHFDVPFGGWKQSGYGKEMGPHWVESWTQTKTVYIKTNL